MSEEETPRRSQGSYAAEDAKTLGRAGVGAATNPRARSTPPNYKVHVLVALSMAFGIRLVANGIKAITG